jgi:hypothetical protein
MAKADQAPGQIKNKGGLRMHADDDGSYQVVWPRGARQVKQKRLARRPASLDGKTVAQLWSYAFKGDHVFAALEEGLKAKFPGVRFIKWDEFGSILGTNQREFVAGLPAELKKRGVDVVITGMAA